LITSSDVSTHLRPAKIANPMKSSGVAAATADGVP
jgi:hypothetical protein